MGSAAAGLAFADSAFISQGLAMRSLSGTGRMESGAAGGGFERGVSLPVPRVEKARKAKQSCRAAGYNVSEVSWPSSPYIDHHRTAEWQTSCAVLSGQWATAQIEEQKSLDSFDERGDGVNRALITLPKPLSVVDLALQPKHNSLLRVSYQGVPGAYSEAAAGKAYPNCEAVPCEQFDTAFQAVELWLVDRAVLPIENSLGGTIHRNYDLLLRHRLHIVGEVQLAVNHCLLAMPGVRKEDVVRVVSHPQALAQVEHNLSKMLGPNLHREAVDDTAGAAQYIAENQLLDTAAVASKKAAEIYGLSVLAEKIQDCQDNVTRFLMLAREPVIPRTDRPFKTSIVFTLEEGPGMLFRALAAFSLRDINLTKIESRPQRNKGLRVVDDSNNGTAKHFDYLFYIDFEASMADPRSQHALGHLQEFATFLRVLGSYPMDVTDPQS